jgi:hypothetical protein
MGMGVPLQTDRLPTEADKLRNVVRMRGDYNRKN